MENFSQQQKKNVVQNQTSTVEQTPYIGFWPRFAAFSIDSVITTLASMALFIPLGMIISLGASELSALNIVLQVLSYCIVPAYFIYFTHASQATLGKQFIGIKVLSQEGHKLTLGKIILRETIGRLVNLFTAYLGYIIVAFTGRRQGLHDMIVSSVVVRRDPTKELSAGRIGLGIFVGMIPLMIFTLIAIVFFIAYRSNI